MSAGLIATGAVALFTSAAALIPGCQAEQGTCQEGYDNVAGSCIPRVDYHPAPVPTTPSVIVIWEEGSGDAFVIEAGTRLDMWMTDVTTDEGDPTTRCVNRGGDVHPVQGLVLCEGIDY